MADAAWCCARDAAVAAVRKAERAVRAGVYHQAEETFRARFPLMVATPAAGCGVDGPG